MDSPDSKPPGRIERFLFDLNDRVFVRELQRPGVVTALTIDYLGPQYQVALWDNGDRKTYWLLADELEPMPTVEAMRAFRTLTRSTGA